MSALPSPRESVRERVGREEWQLRCDLAAAYQLAAILRWTDLIYTHFSARLPGGEEFLINPYGLMFDEITASNLVKIDHRGRVLDDPLGVGYNEAGFVIHGCVHRARPDAVCVLHTHTRAGVAVSAMKCGLLPISQHAMRVQRDVTYHDYEGIALDLDERERLARDLGPTSRAMILRNHGLLTLGRSVREAFELMYYLDCACQIQVDAMAGGMANVLLMSEEAARTAAEQFNRPDRPSERKDWPALLRLLERRGINYRD
ncbi:MAG: class II aldolase/adducin family protein [Burkholderiales bacterium]|nr:class II aldolase/adducin family protein [Burkholderiales bacterium]